MLIFLDAIISILKARFKLKALKKWSIYILIREIILNGRYVKQKTFKYINF